MPIVAVIAGALWTRNRVKMATALVVAYGSHLVGDALALRANGPIVGRLLWPLVTFEPYETDLGFVERFTAYFGTFVAQLTNPENDLLVAGYAAIFVTVALIWVFDGTPGIRRIRRVVGTNY
jgi:hypothetical protein